MGNLLHTYNVEPVNGTTLVKDDITTKDETIESVEPVIINDESLKDESLKDESLKDESLKDESLKDESLKDESKDSQLNDSNIEIVRKKLFIELKERLSEIKKSKINTNEKTSDKDTLTKLQKLMINSSEQLNDEKIKLNAFSQELLIEKKKLD
jgi:hypothetical protein